MAKKYKFLYLFIPIAFVLLIRHATVFPIPHEKNPVCFYSGQRRNDLKLTTLSALKKAKKSLVILTYELTDPAVIKTLNTKAAKGIKITLICDQKRGKPLKKKLHPSIILNLKKCKGLMHEKIILIDEELSLIGTANLTPSSLKMHHNFILGIHNHTFAKLLLEEAPYSSCTIQGQTLELYRLPASGESALNRLTDLIHQAQKEIYISMFTFTHQIIAKALIEANKRGIKVTVALDNYTSRGASNKIYALLQKEGVSIKTNAGLELLHNKWALIDQNIFVLGSANWTKAAFAKNQDFLLIFSPLNSSQSTFINKLK